MKKEEILQPVTILIINNKQPQKGMLLFTIQDKLTIIIAENGKDGLNEIQQNKIDLVLVDSDLPDMKGIDVLHKIQAIKPDTHVILKGENLNAEKETIYNDIMGLLENPLSY